MKTEPTDSVNLSPDDEEEDTRPRNDLGMPSTRKYHVDENDYEPNSEED